MSGIQISVELWLLRHKKHQLVQGWSVIKFWWGEWFFKLNVNLTGEWITRCWFFMRRFVKNIIGLSIIALWPHISRTLEHGVNEFDCFLIGKIHLHQGYTHLQSTKNKVMPYPHMHSPNQPSLEIPFMKKRCHPNIKLKATTNVNHERFSKTNFLHSFFFSILSNWMRWNGSGICFSIPNAIPCLPIPSSPSSHIYSTEPSTLLSLLLVLYYYWGWVYSYCRSLWMEWQEWFAFFISLAQSRVSLMHSNINATPMSHWR